MEGEDLMSATRMTLLVGTTKGAFLISGGYDRSGWTIQGPYCDGWPINHVIGDPETGTLWAGGGGEWHGAGIWRSEDGGSSWKVTRLTKGTMDDWAAKDPNFAKMIGWTGEPLPFTDSFAQVWSLSYAHGTLYAGTKPANLLASENGGRDWVRIHGLTDHPSADSWNPGAAGLVLHTIVPDPDNPKKLWVGISAAGVFATEDSGATWERRNRLSNAEACGHPDHPAAPRDGDVGHCVHNMVRAPSASDVLYQQNHYGVWRSADGGRSWDDRTKGLPSTFGFPIRAFIRGTRIQSGRCHLTVTWPDVFHPTQPQRSGDHEMVAKAGMRCAKACRRRAVSSPSSVKRWPVTPAIQRGSISAQTVAQSSRAATTVRLGKRLRVTCQLFLLSKHSNRGNMCRSTALVSHSIFPRHLNA
jgi:hypothetical protein